MGFNLSAFAGGFATALTDDIDKQRKLAELRGTDAAKIMQANYKTVMEENTKREAELVGNLKVLKTYDASATEAELYSTATNKPVMDAIMGLIKQDSFDASSFKLGNFAKVADNNVTSTALERVKLLSALPVLAKQSAQEQYKPSGNFFKDLTARGSSDAMEKAMRTQAATTGIPLERLRAAQGFVRPQAEDTTVFDMAKLRPEKTFAQQEDAAKLAALKANKNNDPVAATLAAVQLAAIKGIKESMSGEQTEFANKVAGLKNKASSGTPEERASANKELDTIWAVERREALAKKVTKDPDSEAKVPALSSLNTFTSASVARAVASKYGDLVKSKQIAFTEKPDGGVSVQYIGTDVVKRKEILDLQQRAASEALSLYVDSKGNPINRDVATVLNSFKAPARTDEPAPAPAPAAPALPVSKASSLGSASSGRAAAPSTPQAPVLTYDPVTKTWK
jgi:hypothetical protein